MCLLPCWLNGTAQFNIWGYHSGLAEHSSLLRVYVVSLGKGTNIWERDSAFLLIRCQGIQLFALLVLPANSPAWHVSRDIVGVRKRATGSPSGLRQKHPEDIDIHSAVWNSRWRNLWRRQLSWGRYCLSFWFNTKCIWYEYMKKLPEVLT